VNPTDFGPCRSEELSPQKGQRPPEPRLRILASGIFAGWLVEEPGAMRVPVQVSGGVDALGVTHCKSAAHCGQASVAKWSRGLLTPALVASIMSAWCDESSMNG
jgi:hypothetical protein